MASDQESTRAREASHDFGATVTFQQVFKAEIEVINERRRLVNRRDSIELEVEATDISGEPVLRPSERSSLVGLALSGGGTRSAAFCLGVLQALNETKVLDKVDYMSTVSGGGYIGCSLTAALNASGLLHDRPEFPFPKSLQEDEPPELQHIRDFSNYIFPHGATDFLHNAAIYGRGLLVNFVLVAPFLLVASALTLLWYSLRVSSILSFLNPFGLRNFFLTIDLALVFIGVGSVWAIVQSGRTRIHGLEIPSASTSLVGALIVYLPAMAFVELQPLLLDAMLGASGGMSAIWPTWINDLAPVFATIGVIIAFLAVSGALPLAGEIVAFLASMSKYGKSAFESPTWSTYVKGLPAVAIVYVGVWIFPIVLWAAYLKITYWGICINTPAHGCLAPSSLIAITRKNFMWSEQPATTLYLAAAFAFFVFTLLMQPNANSLLRLYRDRLAKAFLFVPKPERGRRQKDLAMYRPRLSEISGLYGPYHLINTALNIRASRIANRRGRDADFFLFSPKYVGSKSTGYVVTRDIEEVSVGLDLATTMAASGAMGAPNIKPLTTTLALLNLRLGYWLPNPLRIRSQSAGRFPLVANFLRFRNVFANYYLLGEIFGLLSERRKSLYLTDGGHVENLGIYELLRRRCRVIIAIDAEADRQMAFRSFHRLVRYVLTDFGIRIDLPCKQIADKSIAGERVIDEQRNSPDNHGPHCAIGEIRYPFGRTGILVYIKASLTGDEDGYVLDYRKRHDAFPHETTPDHWFSEEQFECYRALGFHSANGLFSGSDNFAHLDPDKSPDVRPNVVFLNELFNFATAMT